MFDSTTRAQILGKVEHYFTEKIRANGPTARGVDWNGKDSQFLRFQQLCKIIDRDTPSFSINDFGCGYGALIEFLCIQFSNWEYVGIDVSADMVQAACDKYSHLANVNFAQSDVLSSEADYTIASGIFNIRVGTSEYAWWSYLTDALDMLNTASSRGFSFNCLTKYSDAEKMRADLYYADPCRLFDWCKLHYSPQVALLHDYGLYEFTILVRKQA